VIGLPANLFYGTGIPAAVLIFKRNKIDKKVLFIDASRDFRQGTTQNYLREQDIEKILDTYKKRVSVDKYACLADFNELKENDFNLNIPRYVDTFEPEALVDLKTINAEIDKLKTEIGSVEQRIKGYLQELGLG